MRAQGQGWAVSNKAKIRGWKREFEERERKDRREKGAGVRREQPMGPPSLC